MNHLKLSFKGRKTDELKSHFKMVAWNLLWTLLQLHIALTDQPSEKILNPDYMFLCCNKSEEEYFSLLEVRLFIYSHVKL